MLDDSRKSDSPSHRLPLSRRRLIGAGATGLTALAAAAAFGPSALAGADAAPAAPSAAPRARRGARVVAEHRRGSRVLDLELDSVAMGGKAPVRLLTPDGWDRRSPGDRWPVLYLLPGGDGDHKPWIDDYGIDELPELRDVLVVMPSMPVYGFYTNWRNGGASGPPAVESFHLSEVKPLVERAYGAGPQRVAAGQSQGGFGALSYAARHPGLFRAVAGFSGYVRPLMHTRAVRAACEYLDLDWLKIWGDPVRDRRDWLAHDPYHLARRLRGVPVYLACGDGRVGPLDPPDVEPDPEIPGMVDPEHPYPDDVISPTETIMLEENVALADRLRAVGVSVRTHFTPGTHSPAYWDRELRRALPMLLRELRR